MPQGRSLLVSNSCSDFSNTSGFGFRSNWQPHFLVRAVHQLSLPVILAKKNPSFVLPLCVSCFSTMAPDKKHHLTGAASTAPSFQSFRRDPKMWAWNEISFCDIITSISEKQPPSEKVLDERSTRIAESATIPSCALERGAAVGNSQCFDREREHQWRPAPK
jgi:hypothetical protein